MNKIHVLFQLTALRPGIRKKTLTHLGDSLFDFSISKSAASIHPRHFADLHLVGEQPVELKQMVVVWFLGVFHGATVGCNPHDLFANLFLFAEQWQCVVIALAHLLAVRARDLCTMVQRLGFWQYQRFAKRVVEAASQIATDFNMLDLIFADSARGVIEVWPGTGTLQRNEPTFAKSRAIVFDDFKGAKPTHMVMADFDRDGVLDIATANFEQDTVTILLGETTDGRANGRFRHHAVYTTGDGPMRLAATDLDGDRLIDLLVLHKGDRTLRVLLGNNLRE